MSKQPPEIRKGVAAIIFRRSGKNIEFLVTHRMLRWRGWETLKGGIESGESTIRALLREIEEETGLNKKEVRILKVIRRAKIQFRIPRRFRKEMGGFSFARYEPFYLVEMSPRAKPNLEKDVEGEHDKIRFVTYLKALSMLTYGNVRAALRTAMTMILANDVE